MNAANKLENNKWTLKPIALEQTVLKGSTKGFLFGTAFLAQCSVSRRDHDELYLKKMLEGTKQLF